MKIVKEDLTDSKITLRQAVTYDSPEDSDRTVINEDELFEKFEQDLENVIKDVVLKKDEIFDEDEAELIKNIELIELNDNYVEISVQLSKQLSKSQITYYFKDLIEYLVGEMESQEVRVNVTNVSHMEWDYQRETTYEVDDNDYEDEEYVNLETKGEVQITYDKFIKDESKVSESIDFDKEIKDLENEISRIENEISEIEKAMFNYRGEDEYVLMDYQDDINNLLKEKEECLSEINNLRKDKENSLKTEEMSDATKAFFDEFEYESDYSRFFGRGIAEYIHDTYTGKDIKLLDNYIANELEENALSVDDLRHWNKEWVDKKIKEARIYASRNENVINEEIYSFEEIITEMSNAENYEELRNAANKIVNDNLRIDVEQLIDQCEMDNEDIDVAYSIVTSDLLDDKIGKLNENFEDRERNAKLANDFHKKSKENGFHKIITLDVQDFYGDIEAMLNYISAIASRGHSFSIDVDPHDNDNKQTFNIDGDGSDRITITKVEKLDEEDKKEEGEE